MCKKYTIQAESKEKEKSKNNGIQNFHEDKTKRPTSLLNNIWSAEIVGVSVSVDAVESVSIVIVDNILTPWLSDVTCRQPILKILLPCLVSLYPL